MKKLAKSSVSRISETTALPVGGERCIGKEPCIGRVPSIGDQSSHYGAGTKKSSGWGSRGLCSWGPHLWWGRERKLRQRNLRSITGIQDAGAMALRGSVGGDPQNGSK